MRVKSLKLVNFRNFREKYFNFEEGINLISAPNGMGKTNILESLRIMCYGKPIFAVKESDIINFQNAASELPFTKIILDWDNDDEHESIYTLSPTIRPLKSLVIDNHKKLPKTFIGKFSTVWFSPETINIITASPKSRRVLLDVYFSQLSVEYISALNEYQKALEARNRVLKSSDRSGINYYLDKYDEILSIRAVDLIKVKKELALKLKEEVDKSSKAQKRYEISWVFEPNVEYSEVFDENLEYKINDALKNSRIKDITSKRTNVGPHRDNWTLKLVDLETDIKNGYDLRYYGSRGQKRMGLLVFTLAIVEMLEIVKESKPVLLLDDVVSELDEENVGLILDMLHGTNQQSIITSTHDKIEGLDRVNLIKL